MGFNIRTNFPGVDVYYAGEVKGSYCWSHDRLLAMKFETLHAAIVQMDELQRDFPFPLECAASVESTSAPAFTPTGESYLSELRDKAALELFLNLAKPWNEYTTVTGMHNARVAFAFANDFISIRRRQND